MKPYIVYCSNQTLAAECVDEYYAKSQIFAQFIDEPRPECRNLNLQGFLVKPLQRLCKYPLLLRELIKETEPGIDLNDLEQAFLDIKAILDEANERTREVEGLKKLQSIQKLLSKCDVRVLLFQALSLVF